MTSTADVELRSVVKFCVGLGKSPAETVKMIRAAETLPSCGKTFVYKWHERFRNGRKSIDDDERAGRPSIVLASNKNRVKVLVNADRRITVRDIAETLHISALVVHQILTTDLGMSKVSARWIPSLLKEEEKQHRVDCSEMFLRRFDTEGDDFINRIITTDETWLLHFDPETKIQSSVWKTPRTPPPKKARVQKSCEKEMYIFFMDRRGMILQHRVRDGHTVNADYHSQVLRRDLVQALRKKRPDLDHDRVILHQDNAPAHKAHSTLLEMNVLGFELLEHPPYSPDLAPMDFTVFPELKKLLRGQHFGTSSELQIVTQKVVSGFSSEWYNDNS